jgi:hypothetical protein
LCITEEEVAMTSEAKYENIFTLTSDKNENKRLKYFTEGKRPLGRPRRRWEEGIRMDLGGLAPRS